MSDDQRTEDQRQADAAMELAIENLIRVYFPDTGPTMVTDFIAVVGVQELVGEESAGGTYELFRNGSMPNWKALGLIESAKAHLIARERE